tara:strand:+ start:49 stop:267 length:219 start_codon:yes stop_codon:yes gene_type:complete
MEYMNIKVKWGNLIHNDNTIKRTITTFFSSKEDMKEAWSKRNNDSNCILNIISMSMTISEYVPAEEYFNWEE